MWKVLELERQILKVRTSVDSGVPWKDYASDLKACSWVFAMDLKVCKWDILMARKLVKKSGLSLITNLFP